MSAGLGLVFLTVFFDGRTSLFGQSSPSARSLKQGAVATLQQIAIADKDLRESVTKAANAISQSLSDDKNASLFLDDVRILLPPKGTRVFEREAEAADRLVAASKAKDTPANVRVVLDNVVAVLVQADRQIAELSVVSAERLVLAGQGRAAAVARARQEFDQAVRQADPLKAIEGFKNAWQSAQGVVDQNGLVISSFSDSPTPFSSRLTSNRLTATFQSLKNENGDDNGSNKNKNKDNNDRNGGNNLDQQDSRQSIEFIEVIQDASTGATIRNLTTIQDVPVFPKGGDDSFKATTWSATLTSSWDGKDNTGQIVKDSTYNFVAFGRVLDVGHGGKDDKKDDNQNDRIVAVAFPISGSVMLDNTPPVITAVTDRSPNAAGWYNANVLVTFVCFDKTSGVASCPAPITVSSEGAKQVIAGIAKDNAGNTASTQIVISLDKTPPTVTTTRLPAPNAGGWNNANVTVSFAGTDALSGLASCTAPITLTTEGSNQSASGTCTDIAGNTSSPVVVAGINIDKTPPTLAITSPTDGATVLTPTITVSGTVSDALSGVSAVTCDGVSGSIASGNFSCTKTLNAGPNTINVQASDVAGNSATAMTHVTLSLGPLVQITTPTNLSFVNQSPITVNGTVSDPTATLSINGISAPLSAGKFSVQVPLLEGNNTLTAVAQDAGGVGTASVEVTLDTTPPKVTIDSPFDGYVTTDSTITVTGKANDLVVGTVNDQQVQVTVNALPAQVANRGFQISGIRLALGDNTVQAVAKDRAGNGATTTITVRRVTASTPEIKVIDGNAQSGAIGSELPQPLVIALQDDSGKPVPSQSVVFAVTQNNGVLNGSAATLAVTTDSSGQAQVHWTLGAHAGAGSNMVEATANGFTGTAIFTATGIASSAANISVDAGGQQTGVAGQALPFPFVVVVTDSAHNRLGNVPVTFQVKQGGGSLNGQPSLTTNTDSDGRAAAFLTLGLQEGIENNLVEATFPGNTGFTAAFTASGRIPGSASATQISGVILDNTNAPVPGATVRAFLYNVPAQVSGGLPPTVSAQTDQQGQFSIAGAPVGFVKLIVDASAVQRPGKWPNLEYELVTVAGQNNTLGQPIYLLPLDTQNQLCVSPTIGGTLTLPQVPGFSLTVQPGAATFPGGSRTGCVTVTPVHPDKIPMVPGFGQQPKFIVTIQPAGTMFNPPAAITLPNTEGLKTREVTEMYSFDHDLATFVSVGTATVSEDGTAIRSDPGVGVLKAGWYCGGPPTPTGSAGTCPDCQKCQGSQCIADRNQNNSPCGDTQRTLNLFCGSKPISIDVTGTYQRKCNGGDCKESACDIERVSKGMIGAINALCNMTCIPDDLRSYLMTSLLSKGLFQATCAIGNTSELCGQAGPGVLFFVPNTFLPVCTSDPNASDVALHELLHRLTGKDHSQPINWDTDLMYGCQKACFPSTPYPNAKASACTLQNAF
jgi:hypothetical protein